MNPIEVVPTRLTMMLAVSSASPVVRGKFGRNPHPNFEGSTLPAKPILTTTMRKRATMAIITTPRNTPRFSVLSKNSRTGLEKGWL